MGARLEIREGETLLERLLEQGAGIGHDCGGKLACASCRVAILDGGESIPAASEDELDMLDRAGTAGYGSRLSCQVEGPAELVVELPALPSPPARSKPSRVTTTARARGYLARQLRAQPGAIGLRLKVERSGCSGLRHRVEAAGAIGAHDNVFRDGEITIIVDVDSLPFLAGTVIDVGEAGLNRNLRFDNPNATASCGCGESFSALDPATVGASMLDGLSSLQGATRMIELKVNDMTCGHCVGAVTKAVKELDPQAQVRVDLGTKRVSVESAKPAGEVIHAIEEAGYPAVPA
jgi:iron-sulfur cluster assembly protein